MTGVLVLSRRFLKGCSMNQQVSTWSALTTAFNCRPNSKSLLVAPMPYESGLFGIPELKSPSGFEVLKEKVVSDTKRLIDESCSPARQRKMVEIFDELSDSLCQVADVAEFIRIAHPRESFSEAACDASLYVSGIVENLNTNKKFYEALKYVSENGDIVHTSPVDNHVAKLFLFDFELSGIHLEEDDRNHVLKLNDGILYDSQQFMKYSVYSQLVPKELLPQNVRHLFSVEGNNVIVTGLCADSPNSLARETAYKIFLLPSKKQSLYLDRLLQSRLQLAQVCGFPTYSHRALKGCTAGSPEMVSEFLETLTDKLRPRAEADFKIMLEMKKSEGSTSPVAPWDTPYYTQKAKKEWLRMAASEFSPFFSLGGCMEGLNLLVNALFGINLQPVELQRGEAWTADLYKLEVVHETEGLLGHIYCDFYERAGKPNQDCHYTIRGGKVLPDGSYQNPIVALMLNFPVPRWSSPSLLTPSMVDNLFHEMGHALHSMLARTRYQHVTGTRCSTDFAEVPSVLMEYFASDPRVLRLFARHFQTHEPLPDEMLTRLCASKQLFSSSEMQLQVFYSALDQRYHSESPLGPTGNTTDVLAAVQKQYYTLPYVPNTAWQLRFSHLVGYGAKYYSYLMSRAIASWTWQQCFEADPLSRSQGERYRHECLAHGGGKPPQALVSDFLKKDVTASQLVASLLQDLESKSHQIEVARRGLSIK